MAEAIQRCQLDGCNRAASTRCFCCNKNVCTRHFSHHIDAVKAQIDPLANDINAMIENIQGLTIDKITEASFVRLQQWKMDMYKLIDEIFLAKSKELEDLIEKNKQKFDEHKKQQSEMIMKIQDGVRQLTEDGDATYEQIQLLKTKLATVETSLASFEKDFVSVDAKVLAQGLITISSNLNKPTVIQNQRINPQTPLQQNLPSPMIVDQRPAVSARERRKAHRISNVESNPAQPVFGGFGSNPLNTPLLFGVPAQLNPFGHNQQNSPGGVFGFNNNGQK